MDQNHQNKLKELNHWQIKEGRLVKQLKFKNFVELMAFVNKMAELAEGLNHHPDFSVSYNKLDISIFTHSEGKITDRDFNLAKRIDGLQ